MRQVLHNAFSWYLERDLAERVERVYHFITHPHYSFTIDVDGNTYI